MEKRERAKPLDGDKGWSYHLELDPLQYFQEEYVPGKYDFIFRELLRPYTWRDDLPENLNCLEAALYAEARRELHGILNAPTVFRAEAIFNLRNLVPNDFEFYNLLLHYMNKYFCV